MRDRKRATNTHSLWGEALQNVDVIAKKELIQTRSKRNLKKQRRREVISIKKVKEEKGRLVLNM